MNNLIYQIDGIYNEKGEYKNKMQLKVDPPSLVIEDENENVALFELNEEFVIRLNQEMKKLDNLYKGLPPENDKKPINTFSDLKNYINDAIANKPVKLLSAVLMITIILYVIISNIF